MLPLLAALLPLPAAAHEVRPGYLEITETEPLRYAVSWTQPVRSGRQQIYGLALRPVFPTACERGGESAFGHRPGALTESFALNCTESLAGQSIGVQGLQQTITDVFVRLVLADGRELSLRLTPTQPTQQIVEIVGGGALLGEYFLLGVEHLLLGYDHILFVLGLILLIAHWRMLVATITAFTLAHSITLGLSVFGLVTLPSAPVEASIALSVLFLACELMRSPEQRSVVANRFPWLIAFGFGLLHGFGFAGVLADIGLPSQAALWALALFNVGLECGQLLVVAAVLLWLRLLGALPPVAAGAVRLRRPLIALMGVLAAWWSVGQVAAIVGWQV